MHDVKYVELIKTY